jgi:hypothetical protein
MAFLEGTSYFVRVRPNTFSDSAIQTYLTLKVLDGLPLRQTVGKRRVHLKE